MNIFNGIYGILAADTDVTDILGTGDNMSFFITDEDGDKPPFAVYEEDDDDPEPTKDTTSEVDTVGFQILTSGKTAEAAYDLASKTRTAIDRFRGVSNTISFNSINFEDRSLHWEGEKATRLYIVTSQYTARIIRSGNTPSTTCLPGSVSNSDATYSASVASGGSLVLPDINHVDSDGSSVPTPAQTVFVATLQPVNLVLDFDATALDVQSITIGAAQAGTMTGQTLTTNVTSATYKVNTVTKTFPFTVVATDVLEVTIVRTVPSTAAQMEINGTL